MTCFFCKGEMSDGLTTDLTDLNTSIIVIRNVPCHKCEQCGEVSFPLDVSERLEQIVDSLKGSVTEVAIVKYSSEAA
jgi:YgiT-type zinc finger domain-containing protein